MNDISYNSVHLPSKQLKTNNDEILKISRFDNTKLTLYCNQNIADLYTNQH